MWSGRAKWQCAAGGRLPPAFAQVLDEEFAELKIEADVDEVAMGLLRSLGLPTPPPYDRSKDNLLSSAQLPLLGEPSAPWKMRVNCVKSKA